VCWAHNLLAWIDLHHARYDQAKEHWLTFLGIAQEIDHRRGEALSLRGLGIVAYFEGQYARAQGLEEQSLALFRELGERWWTVDRLDALGRIALAAGDLERAGARYREALAAAEELADLEHVAWALCGLGEVALAMEDLETARRCCRRALQVALEDARARTSRQALVSMARLHAQAGDRALAVELVALGFHAYPDRLGEEVPRAEAFLRDLRSGLSPDAYATAQARGRARELEVTLKELVAELDRGSHSRLER
jgi:tetratricopeptide (TPR) repeat protein